jgi:hypothetical protein
MTETDATVLVDTCRVVRVVCCNGFYHLTAQTGSTMKGVRFVGGGCPAQGRAFS